MFWWDCDSGTVREDGAKTYFKNGQEIAYPWVPMATLDELKATDSLLLARRCALIAADHTRPLEITEQGRKLKQEWNSLCAQGQPWDVRENDALIRRLNLLRDRMAEFLLRNELSLAAGG